MMAAQVALIRQEAAKDAIGLRAITTGINYEYRLWGSIFAVKSGFAKTVILRREAWAGGGKCPEAKFSTKLKVANF